MKTYSLPSKNEAAILCSVYNRSCPTISEIMDDTELTRNSVQGHTARLVAKGWLRRVGVARATALGGLPRPIFDLTFNGLKFVDFIKGLT